MISVISFELLYEDIGRSSASSVTAVCEAAPQTAALEEKIKCFSPALTAQASKLRDF